MSGRSRRTRPRRADLSQHFLCAACAARLVQATSIQSADFVVEIGAGRGALTRQLLKRTRHLRAVELDRYLVAKLVEQFGDSADVVAGDFLKLPLPEHPYKVVGNVPFSKSTDIVERLVAGPLPPEDAWLVVQREFAWRLCGLPFTAETLWSLRLKPFWHVEIVDRLRRTDFDPPPSVESVLLWLSRRGRPLLSESETTLYGEIIGSAFRGGNGTVRQALRPWLSKVQLRRLAADLKFEPNAYASSLLFEQWLGILRFLARR